MATLEVTAMSERGRALLPGVLACAVVAAAASFLAQHHGAPVMLFALLLGMAMNFLSTEGPCAAGIEWCSRTLLRVGIALLGARITLAQVAELGWGPLAVVVLCVVLTITVSIVVARWLGFQRSFGLLTGGATAICGASAAMALSAALPAHPLKERATLFTVIGVSALSTLAMITYPMLAQTFGWSPQQAGIFLGATIHDVAQVVGAGYSLSPATGDTAAVVKLVRVAMLVPVIVVATLLMRAEAAAPAAGATATRRPPLLPAFVLAFVALVAVNSVGLVPAGLQSLGAEASRWCLVIAIAAIGMKTQLRELATVGFKPVALMVGETVFLAVLAAALMRWLA